MSCGKHIHETLTAFDKSVTNAPRGSDYVDMHLYTAYLGRVNVKVARTANPNEVMLECMSGRSGDIVLRVIDAQVGRVDYRTRPTLRSLTRVPPTIVNIQENKETFFQIQKIEMMKARASKNKDGMAKQNEVFKKFKMSDPIAYQELNNKYSMGLAQNQLQMDAKDPEALRRLYVKNSCVDIHFNTIEYLLFLQTKLNRDSINSGKLLLSIFNVPKLDNAFFSGEYMLYGNGDNMFYPLTSIDVSAHELTHGLVQATAGLEYSGHSGALNESFADMIGTALELHLYEKFNADADTTNDLLGEADWLCGEDIGKAVKYIRNLRDPDQADHPQPATYRGQYWADPNNEAADYGGVHTNSGVTNRCFYLLTEALGLGTSLPLVFICLLRLRARSDMIDFRDTLLECAPESMRAKVVVCLSAVGLTGEAVSDWNKSPAENRQAPAPTPAPQPAPQQPTQVPYPNKHIPYINGLCCPHCLCLAAPQRSGIAHEVGRAAQYDELSYERFRLNNEGQSKREVIEISSDDDDEEPPTRRRSKRLRKE